MKRSNGSEIANHGIKKYFRKTSENEVVVTRMSTNDDETIGESRTSMIEERDLVEGDKQTSESTSDNGMCFITDAFSI